MTEGSPRLDAGGFPALQVIDAQCWTAGVGAGFQDRGIEGSTFVRREFLAT